MHVKAFNLIDVDKDGNITVEELIKVIENVGGSMSQDEARGLIRKVYVIFYLDNTIYQFFYL